MFRVPGGGGGALGAARRTRTLHYVACCVRQLQFLEVIRSVDGAVCEL